MSSSDICTLCQIGVAHFLARTDKPARIGRRRRKRILDLYYAVLRFPDQWLNGFYCLLVRYEASKDPVPCQIALELLPLVHPDLRFNEAVFLLNGG